MRIVHYHRGLLLEHGGVVRAVLDICAGLADAGHEVIVLSPTTQDAPEAWKRGEEGYPRAIEVPEPWIMGGWFGRGGLRVIREHLAGADVLHLHGVWGPFNGQLARTAQEMGIPYVNSLHGMLDDWCMSQRSAKKRFFLRVQGRRTLEQAYAVHSTARAELDQSIKWFPKGNGVIVPLVFDTSDFETLPGPAAARARFPELDGDRPVILFLSRIHYKKGVELLVRAARRWRDSGRDPIVVIAGTGDDSYVEQLKALARDLDVEDTVRFVGFVSGTEKVSLYEAADVFVLPTSQENFGFVIFEALAAGTPVVTTRGVDTWPELVASGGSIIVDANDEAIAACVDELIDDAPRRTTMGASGRRWVLENLRTSAVMGHFVALYEAAVSDRTTS